MNHDHSKMMMDRMSASSTPASVNVNMQMNHMNHMNHMKMDMPTNSSGGHMMMMYFHTMLSDYVLFKECFVNTAGGMVGACAVIFILAILYEGLKVLREHLLLAAKRRGRGSPAASFVPDGAQPQTYVPHGGEIGMLSGAHLLQTGLHAVQITVSYVLMLVFMTYSVWLCLAVVLGSTTGYFLFGWLRRTAIDISEHCH